MTLKGWRLWLARIIVAIVILIFVVGCIAVIRFAWIHLGPPLFSINPAGVFGAIAGWLGWFAASQAALWVTALATLFLYRATRILARATHIEHALAGPFLRVEFAILDEQSSMREFRDTYRTDWKVADSNDVHLVPHLLPPTLIRITISNDQTASHGVASDVKAEVSLVFGAADNVAPHPYVIKRTVNAAAIRAGNAVAGPVFNIGTLKNFMVVTTSIEYSDILKKRRGAAIGNSLRRTVEGVVSVGANVFGPKDGEYTSAVP